MGKQDNKIPFEYTASGIKQRYREEAERQDENAVFIEGRRATREIGRQILEKIMEYYKD